jgi:hypothetical protein
MSEADCIFCRILAGEAPGTFVHRAELEAVAARIIGPA